MFDGPDDPAKINLLITQRLSWFIFTKEKYSIQVNRIWLDRVTNLVKTDSILPTNLRTINRDGNRLSQPSIYNIWAWLTWKILSLSIT